MQARTDDFHRVHEEFSILRPWERTAQLYINPIARDYVERFGPARDGTADGVWVPYDNRMQWLDFRTHALTARSSPPLRRLDYRGAALGERYVTLDSMDGAVKCIHGPTGKTDLVGNWREYIHAVDRTDRMQENIADGWLSSIAGSRGRSAADGASRAPRKPAKYPD